jgi:ribosomal protein L29
MDIKELRTKSQAELAGMVKELRGKLTDLRVKARLGEIKAVHELGSIRKDIARIMTLLNK